MEVFLEVIQVVESVVLDYGEMRTQIDVQIPLQDIHRVNLKLTVVLLVVADLVKIQALTNLERKVVVILVAIHSKVTKSLEVRLLPLC